MAVGEEANPGARPGAAQVFRFSTEAFREHERIAAWREVFGQTVLRIDIAPRESGIFQAQAEIILGPSIGLMRAETSAAEQGNSPSLITNDDVSFGCVLDAPWRARQLGRDSALEPGDGVLMSNSDVGALAFPQACRYVTFGIPRAALAPRVPDLGALFARPVAKENPALRMLRRYLDLGIDGLVAGEPALQQAFADHVADLLALALGATRDAAEQARSRGLAAARLRAIQDDVRRNLAQADLSVHAIAARHGLSPRAVQRLFEDSGTTFTQYLTEQRLDAARHALRAAAVTRAAISTIAYDCGFSDVSHFNRLFRRRFACTPSDIRTGRA
jgi:AraC-like DNA-binding protein